MTLEVKRLEEIHHAARTILQQAPAPGVFLFFADMGTGKTTLINALCQAMGVPANSVSSPTFSIVNEYMGKQGPIYHFDFYRLREEEEAYDLGYEEYFYSGHFCFVEWPEKIPHLWPAEHVKIFMQAMPDGQRHISIEINKPFGVNY